MAERILGPQGSKRRKRFLWVPALLIACLALFAIGQAQAVHNVGLFQLDGDTWQTNPPGPNAYGPGGTEDWSNVCAKFAVIDATNTPGADVCHPSGTIASLGSATTADKSTFITDGFDQQPDGIYKGGTDDGSINNPPDGIGGSVWEWKKANPSPNKADIEQAFAAEFICPDDPNPACPVGYRGHKIMYFGGTRFANNGDTNIAIWFLHNKVTPCGHDAVCTFNSDGTVKTAACAPTSGCGFTGSHTVGNCSKGGTTCGDIFIQSAFTSKPSINVFEWVGPNGVPSGGSCISAACDLNQIPLPVGANNNKCESSGVNNDKGCALVNDVATVGGNGQVPSPWLFRDQTNSTPNNTYGASELFEGGLDLTALGFGDVCISTFVLNTRSSGSSVNSTDQDFALGNLGSCQTTLSTTAGFTAGTKIGGGSVSSGTDAANVTVQGVSTWSGTLDFYLCGPTSGTCTDTGAGKGIHVSSKTIDNTTSQPISSAVDANNDGTATLTSVGTYCWFARFTPDAATAAKGVGGASDDGSANTPNKECFFVGKATPALDTQAVIPNPNTPPPAFIAVPANFKTPFGSPVYDQATLSNAAKEPGSDGGKGKLDATATTWTTINATNGQYGGVISFTLKGYDGLNNKTPNCDDNAVANTTAGESQTFPITVNVSATLGNTTYPRDANGPTAVHFIPNSPGTYHWIASYDLANSVNNTVPAGHNSDCLDTKEDVTVQQIATSVKSKQSWFPNDTATVTAASGNLAAGGTVVFTLYDDASCGTGTGLQRYTESYTLAGGQTTEEARTHNFTGGKDSANNNVTPFEITTAYPASPTSTTSNTSNYSWKVVYTPAANDPAHTGSSSSCASATHTEKFVITYLNDAG